ncbi:MAG TPA: ATP phosphoribosyltransferase [Caulobacteraceae bacterium]|jgi:ATP phosphoribosyltransferase|nr:ATP phosphoribosyltransferase [Caulobacteraceae bacterium]
MTGPLILGLPSKGRQKEQTEEWLADCGLPVRASGGERGYTARLDGLAGVEVRLVSASEIAGQLFAGELHLGVTGEDLLHELSDDLGAHVSLIQALGYGRADLVVAAPKSWIDVDTMADVDEVAHLFLARTGRRLRVATKYLVQTRAFFARHGIVDYRIVESGGATEGAPAAGAAELITDITTTGATLAANGLKILGDGLILSSQFQLAASLAAEWDAGRLHTARRLVGILEGRARAKRSASLTWPAEADAAARAAVAGIPGAAARQHGVLVDEARLFDTTAKLADAGVGPVVVTHPTYVFEPSSAPIEALAERLGEAN